MTRNKKIRYIKDKKVLMMDLTITVNTPDVRIETPALFHGAKIKEAKNLIIKDGKLIITCLQPDYKKALQTLHTLLGVLEISKAPVKKEAKKVEKKASDSEK